MGKDISSRGNNKCKDLKVLEILRSPGNMGVGGEVCQASFVGIGTSSPGREIHPRVWANQCDAGFGESHRGVQGDLGP